MLLKKQMIMMTMVIFLLGGALSQSVGAEEDVTALKQQIEALQQRVEELEAVQGGRIAPRSSARQLAPSSGFFDGGWDPFDEMDRIHEEMEQMLSQPLEGRSYRGGSFNGSMSMKGFQGQDVELEETDKGYVIHFDMEGLNQEKIDVEINPHSVTLSGQYEEKTEEKNPDGVFHSSRFGSFMKTIPLPLDADTEAMTTTKKDGQLVITILKKS